MDVEIRYKQVESPPALSEHVHRQIGFTLGRFYTRLIRMTIRFEDTNGPKGGLDKVCRVEAHGDFGSRVVECRGFDLFAVSNRALAMMERTVARALGAKLAKRTPR